MARDQSALNDHSVGAIIVNYNGGEPILECIRSLQRQTLTPAHIVVVDNLSTDGSSEKIRTQFPDVTIIENGYNAGWGVGCNVGIKSINTEYVALINNDAYLDTQCLEEMVRAIQSRPNYGSCASKIFLWDNPKTIEVAGVVIYRDRSSIARGRLQPSDRYNDFEEVFCASDCCSLYRRDLLLRIGLHDPDFFMYCDDTDIGWRLQLTGWRYVYTPKAMAYHAHSRSSGSYSDFKAYHVERNRLYLCLKYFPFPYLVEGFFFSGYRYLYQVWMSRQGKGALAKYRKGSSLIYGLKILMKAHWHAMKSAPTMIRRRREFQSMNHPSRGQFEKLLHRYGGTANQIASYE
jgi:GT2 family glycosyltransferase